MLSVNEWHLVCTPRFMDKVCHGTMGGLCRYHCHSASPVGPCLWFNVIFMVYRREGAECRFYEGSGLDMYFLHAVFLVSII